MFEVGSFRFGCNPEGTALWTGRERSSDVRHQDRTWFSRGLKAKMSNEKTARTRREGQKSVILLDRLGTCRKLVIYIVLHPKSTAINSLVSQSADVFLTANHYPDPGAGPLFHLRWSCRRTWITWIACRRSWRHPCCFERPTGHGAIRRTCRNPKVALRRLSVIFVVAAPGGCPAMSSTILC